MPDSSLQEFIEERWGEADVTRIARVRTGGDNNDKGSRYEASFSVYLIAKYEAEGVGQDVRVSAQEEAWVDDVCVRHGDQLKVNYQAKNSAGDAASWDAEMTERFSKQQAIDTDYHCFPDASQVLLVSCKDKSLKNKVKIPGDMVGFASCEFYPYFDQPTNVLYSHEPTIDAVSRICEEPTLDVMQAAMLAIMAQWQNQPSATPVRVSDLIAEAKKTIKPNIFKEVGGPKPPQWLTDVLSPFPSASIKVQSGDFIVAFKGLTVRLPGSLAQGPAPDVGEVCGEQGLVELLFCLSSQAQL